MQGRVHPPISRREHDFRVPVRQIHSPAVRPIDDLIDAGQGPGREELEQRAGVQRRPVREPQADDAGLTAVRGGLLLPHLAGRPRVHLEHRLVELPHTSEPGSERDVGEPETGRLDEDSRGLGPLGAGEGERPGAEFGGEHPVEVPFGVSEPGREPRYAFPVDDPVADEAHGPSDGVGAGVPFGRAGCGVGPAPAAGAESAALGCGRAHVERDVLPFRGDGRTGRPAVDAGGPDGRVEAPVEPRVAAVDGPVTVFEVQLHAVESAPVRSRRLAGFGHDRARRVASGVPSGSGGERRGCVNFS
jgi:hypothetical protein